MVEFITTSMTAVWILCGVLAIFLFVAAANDSFGVAFWLTVLGLAALQLITVADPWSWVKSHPYTIGILLAAYFPAGVLWSLFRWWKTLQKAAVDIRSDRGRFTPSGIYPTWEEWVKGHLPKASLNKDRIICWITYWPFSAAAYLLLDLLQEIGEWVYAKISRLYQSLADRVAASLKDDNA